MNLTDRVVYNRFEHKFATTVSGWHVTSVLVCLTHLSPVYTASTVVQWAKYLFITTRGQKASLFIYLFFVLTANETVKK